MTDKPPPRLPSGTPLGDRFIVRRCLGTGGFGTVYLADQKVFDLTLRQVALKLFHQGSVDESNARERLSEAVVLMRFQEEMRFLKEEKRQAASQHMVTVLDAGFLLVPWEPGNKGKATRQAFVAMEYVPGYRLPSGQTARTLQDMIQAFRPVPVEMALRWMAQILCAVAWMHTLNPPVLHCDLKSDNVLPDGPYRLKVADFGLAQLAFGAIGLHGGAGALNCQAPETLAGVEPTPASDVYSLGLMLHEMLAGKHPLAGVGVAEHLGGDQDGCLRRQREAREAGIASLTTAANPDLARHPLVIEIMEKCLRYRAPERYANAKTLLDDIEAYTQGDEPPDLARLIAEVDAYSRQGRKDEATARAEAALAAFPGAVAAHACLARMLVIVARWQDAVRLCLTATKLSGISDADRAMLLELSADAYDVGGLPSVAASMRDRAASARKGNHR